MFVIKPYQLAGQWCFDDATRDLKAEPFVCGMSEMITRAAGDKEGFSIKFSPEPFPGSQFTLEWQNADNGGNWYSCPELGEDTGWLCPALYKYFTDAPQRIYIAIENDTQS